MIQVKKKVAEMLGIKPDKDGDYIVNSKKKLSVIQVEKLLAETEVEQKLIAPSQLMEVFEALRNLYNSADSLNAKPSEQRMNEAKDVLDKYWKLFTPQP